jgi:NAD(P)-dependent dehydrogenase (short-subunit alcohol dehydrogenase family)
VSSPNLPLEGRVALVTGAVRPRGMGAATAQRPAQLGADVVITEIARPRSDLQVLTVGLGDSREALDGVAARVREEHGRRCVPFALDVTDAEQAAAVVHEVIGTFGRLDALVNNAGTPVGFGDFAEGSDAELGTEGNRASPMPNRLCPVHSSPIT